MIHPDTASLQSPSAWIGIDVSKAWLDLCLIGEGIGASAFYRRCPRHFASGFADAGPALTGGQPHPHLPLCTGLRGGPFDARLWVATGGDRDESDGRAKQQRHIQADPLWDGVAFPAAGMQMTETSKVQYWGAPPSTRRAFLASLCALPLAGCQDGSESIRFRVIAMVMYEGKKYEASTVMECHYTRVTNSLVGRGGSTRLYGESLIFDLPNGKTFFVLPLWNDGGSLSRVFEGAVLQTFGIDSSFGTLKDEDFAKMKAASGRKPFKYSGHMPAFVVFRDVTQPKTIFELQPYKLEQTFPGVKFVGLDIEITDAPVTKKLRQRLPWLDAGKQVFERRAPGDQRRARQFPIGYLITRAHFFGNGSR